MRFESSLIKHVSGRRLEPRKWGKQEEGFASWVEAAGTWLKSGSRSKSEYLARDLTIEKEEDEY